MTMAEQIIRARKKAGLTQRELAKQLNVTNKAVSRWETGGGMPDLIQLVPLCRVLDLSLQELWMVLRRGSESSLSAVF